MWRAQLNRSIREVRFVLKQTPEHHGVWRFVEQKLPSIRMLNPAAFFQISEMTEHFETKSAVHLVYGDSKCQEDVIESSGLSMEQLEEILRQKVAYGLTLEREVFQTNDDRELPYDVVEARSTIKYMDDGFGY